LRISVAASAGHSAAALDRVAERQLAIHSASGWSPWASARDLRAEVVDGASGVLVRPFDLDELACRVTLLVEFPSARRARRGRTREAGARFSYPAMVRAIDGVYRDALGLSRTSAPARPRPRERSTS
jgi:hypothetical protein